MLGALSPRPARTASELVVRLDGMDLPLSINDLGGWLRGEERGSSELSVWLNLLEEDSRQGVVELLKAPLINDRSMARQILNSWAGRRLLDQVSDLVLVDDDATGQTVQVTLESLLDKRAQVTTLDLLEALPARRVRLDLDALLLGKHPQHLERRDAAKRVKSILGEYEAVLGRGGAPSRVVDRHGVDDRSVTVEYQSFRLHKIFQLLEGGQAFLEVVGEEGRDDFTDFALDERRQIVQREIDAVIGHAALRKIVGSNALVAFAGADLRLALGGVLGVFLGDLLFQ